jgi:hypothetical protein
MTDTTTIPDHRAIVDAYFTCWNTLDAAERATAVALAYASDAHLVDPLVDVRGHDELTATFTAFHSMYPGHSFRQQGGIDAHHSLARWGWEMVDADGNVVLDGIDVAIIGADGRITNVAGFFGAELPA